jgi:hypothetical protein
LQGAVAIRGVVPSFSNMIRPWRQYLLLLLLLLLLVV